MVLKTCVAKDCIEPWAVIHPKGNVNRLEEALDPRYDAFYENNYKINSVSFTQCEAGQIVASEGPLEPSVYSEGVKWEDFS